MQRNFLPAQIGIAMTKAEFCYATGLTPYKLRKLLQEKSVKYRKLGVTKWDKLLMPAAVRELCDDTGLQIDIDYYMQYVEGIRNRNRATERGDKTLTATP